MPPARRHKDSNVPSRAGWAKLNGLDMVLMGSMRPRQSQKAGLTALKRLMELATEGNGQLSIVLVGHPKLRNDLRRPKMEEIGDRTTVFEFGGLRDQQRDYIDWVLKASLSEGVAPDDVLTDEAATLLPPSSRRRCRSASTSCARSKQDLNSAPSRSTLPSSGPSCPARSTTLNRADAQRLRPGQPCGAVRRQTRRDPPAPARRPGSEAVAGAHGRNARRRTADVSLSERASSRPISRPSHRSCAHSQTACVRHPLQSQLMCVRKWP